MKKEKNGIDIFNKDVDMLLYEEDSSRFFLLLLFAMVLFLGVGYLMSNVEIKSVNNDFLSKSLLMNSSNKTRVIRKNSGKIVGNLELEFKQNR